jgi:hypothetical protein
MSNNEEKLNILKKKKLTAKTIVEQQRNEIRILKSSLTLNQRLEEIFQKLNNRNNLNRILYDKILYKNSHSNEQIHHTIDDLSKLIEQILNILSIDDNLDFNHQELDVILKNQKESFQLIKWKLMDIYAHRVADEVSCITS